VSDTSESVKVGIISCSGEEIPEGTLSRLAVLRVLNLLRPDAGVTLCLPLFLAGDPGLRNFARLHPTITVDGCDKQCARWATEKYSGPVARAMVVSEILGSKTGDCQRSLRSPQASDTDAVKALAATIATAVDEVRRETKA
jgi:hypothetical protein